jgi:hypothetical protein
VKIRRASQRATTHTTLSLSNVCSSTIRRCAWVVCVFFSSLQNPNLCFHDVVINIYPTLNVRIIFVRTLSFKFLTLVNIFVGCYYINNRLVPSNPSRPFDFPKVGGPVPLTGHLGRAGHLPPARHSPLEQTTGRLFLVQTMPPFRHGGG